jgi:hypothetical protein
MNVSEPLPFVDETEQQVVRVFIQRCPESDSLRSRPDQPAVKQHSRRIERDSVDPVPTCM